ncbi:MAG: DNA polymerase III subunit beta [Sulfurovum sp. AS07-7]|jgi:predicted nucleotidyltransferase|nr:MAG: DNA polymerase III subunit beta [Sulfurovum sp. AS07-7]TQV61771.1 MAG: nucleotidyltransferase [Sulfurovum sp.]
MNKNEILQKLSAHKEYIQNNYEVDKIGLFGSYAKDMQTNQSDIDFYVVLKKKSIDNMTGLWLYLEKLFDKKIDLLYYHPKMRQGLKNQIEQEAIYA